MKFILKNAVLDEKFTKNFRHWDRFEIENWAAAIALEGPEYAQSRMWYGDYHIAYVGKNRNNKFGSVEDRIDAMSEIVETFKELDDKRFNDDADCLIVYNDETFPLVEKFWKNPCEETCRDLEIAFSQQLQYGDAWFEIEDNDGLRSRYYVWKNC